MSGAKHGGWKAEWIEENADWCVVAPVSPPDADGMTCQPFVCTLSDFYGEDEARLIAAAPDFFAAAQGLVEAWDARTTGAQQIVTGKSDADLQKQAMDAIEGLRAAIAKATGEGA